MYTFCVPCRNVMKIFLCLNKKSTSSMTHHDVHPDHAASPHLAQGLGPEVPTKL